MLEKIDVAQNRKAKPPFVILKQTEPKKISSKHSGVKRLEQQQNRSSDQTVKRKRCSYCVSKSEISKVNQDNQLLSHQINQLQERLNYLVVEEVTAQQVEQVKIFFPNVLVKLALNNIRNCIHITGENKFRNFSTDSGHFGNLRRKHEYE